MQVSLTAIVAGLVSVGASAEPALVCQTQSSPNPIVKEYPGQVTGKYSNQESLRVSSSDFQPGTINGTTAIVPIPLSVARSVIPSQYGILTAAYEKLIPGFPKDMFVKPNGGRHRVSVSSEALLSLSWRHSIRIQIHLLPGSSYRESWSPRHENASTFPSNDVVSSHADPFACRFRYPAEFEGLLDHDVQSGGIKIPDFQVSSDVSQEENSTDRG